MNCLQMATQLDSGVRDLAPLFKALADENRLRILRLIGQEAPPGGLCVMALARALGISQPAVSQHLAVLRGCGLIVRRRQGYFIHCYLNRPRIEACRQAMSDFFGLDQSPLTTAEATAESAPTSGDCHAPEASPLNDSCCSAEHGRPHRRGRHHR